MWLWPRLQGRLKGIGVNLTPGRGRGQPLIAVAAAPPVDPVESASLGELLKGLFNEH